MLAVERQLRRWTRDEYYRMLDLGMFQDQRVELIQGKIIEMAPRRGVHAAVTSLSAKAMTQAFGNNWWVRSQLPISLDDGSEPEPDVSVIRGGERDFIGTGHPKTCVLLIEVADTSLAYDRSKKACLYARFGIPEYWIVNLPELQIEIHRNPITDLAVEDGFRYADIQVAKRGDFVSPQAARDAKIAVADLLP